MNFLSGSGERNWNSPMRDLLITSARRYRMPIWVVSRLYLRPDGSYYSRPVGKWRAWSKDQVIEKAAHAIKRLAVLTAERVK